MKYDVFISYSRKDTPIADRICAAFDRACITYFIDRKGIAGGMEFPQVLADAIEESSLFLFLASENSYQSKFTNNEILYAFNEKPTNSLLPYVIDGSRLPKSLRFSFASINVRNIEEHPIEPVLVDDVLRLLGREAETSAARRVAREEAARQAAAEAARQAQMAVQRQAEAEEAAQRAKEAAEEAARKAKEEKERKAQEEKERKAREEAALKARKEVERCASEQAKQPKQLAGYTLVGAGKKKLSKKDVPFDIQRAQIADTVVEIENNTFECKRKLAAVIIPNSVTKIGELAFASCESLEALVIPNSVKEIGSCAFGSCKKLSSIVIPPSVTKIGMEMFSMCDNLAIVTVAEGNPVYDSRDNCNAIVHTAANSLVAACPTTVIPASVVEIGDRAFVSVNLKAVSIPDSVKRIGRGAFAWSHIESVAIPDSVTCIDHAAFRGTHLTSVILPHSVTEISDCAFYYCNKLQSVTIPDSVTTIGESAFESCNELKEVTIPKSVKTIKGGAFEFCKKLKKVRLLNPHTRYRNYSETLDLLNMNNRHVKFSFPKETEIIKG